MTSEKSGSPNLVFRISEYGVLKCQIAVPSKLMERFLSAFKEELAAKISRLEMETNEQRHYGVHVDTLIEQRDELKSKVKLLVPQCTPSEPYTQLEISVYMQNTDLCFSVSARNTPIYVYGCYSKMSRNMSQTKMPRGRDAEMRSVADFTEDLALFFDAKKVKFIGSGREDFDVRMVGRRPFLLEIVEPKRNLSFTRLRLNVHREVTLFDLKRVRSAAKRYIHCGQEDMHKAYRALIYSAKMRNIEPQTLEVLQKTPLRVLHRRANLVRRRSIEIIECSVHGRYALLTLRAQAGTYIKEFIHGDFGRTAPSVTSILGSFSDCLELDVLEVDRVAIPEDCVLHDITIE